MTDLGAGELAILQQASVVASWILSGLEKILSRFHGAALASSFVLAGLVWYYQRRTDPDVAGKNLFAFIFPRSVWLHRSALLDYRFVLFDKLAIALLAGLGGMLLMGLGFAATPAAAETGGQTVAAGIALIAAYTICLVVTEDFFRYWAHRIMHDSPLLWQFHKVHHSPEVLVPISQMRAHPVNGLVNILRSVLAIGIVTGVFMLIYPGKLSPLTIFGVNAGRFLFDFMGANLRHSHIWLSFGPRWSYLFISPAMHQIHHSKDPRHFNRNYGSQFALWDWMFGTLYVPKAREKLNFGIDADSTERMRTIRGLYLEPFRDAGALVRRRRAARQMKARMGDQTPPHTQPLQNMPSPAQEHSSA